jgi:UDP-N-acetylglucosamine diphosphorylase / glucose-1-phosphate thymidylyltransferase / UDP-N-acetylgalactosamine diphosphorylase / glucosamine-1-phosphate N-acetyltransferase / galactosamine-1-phosphate N-acetyltransferase
MKTEEIFISNDSIAIDLIRSREYPYLVLDSIKDYIIKLGNTLGNDYIKKGEDIWIHKNAHVFESAYIMGPCIIDDSAEVRHSAFIRGSVIIGKNSVLGNSCEIKNSILFDNVQVPHFNYVGDSILGSHSHMGAGSITSNVKSDKQLVVIKNGSDTYETNRKKVGAFLGDYVEVGCNSVLNPGTIIAPYSRVYPLTSVRGVINKNCIVKSMNNIVKKEDM